MTFKPGKEMEEKVRLLEMEAAAKAAAANQQVELQNHEQTESVDHIVGQTETTPS